MDCDGGGKIEQQRFRRRNATNIALDQVPKGPHVLCVNEINRPLPEIEREK